MKKRGRGVACCWYGIARTAEMDRASAWVEMDDGGTAKVAVGVTEIGEGILQVLAQVAAEEIGCRPDQVVLADNDTARVPEAAHAGATRQTYMCANAVALACRDARKRFDQEMARYLGTTPEDIAVHAGKLWLKSKPDITMSLAEAIQICKKRGVVPVGSGGFSTYATPLDPETGRSDTWQTYVWGTQIAEVEVDTVTGEVKVLEMWAAHDVGRAINPQGVEGQIEGAIAQGVGYGLKEEFNPKRPGFSAYKLPTSLDMPEVHSIIIENPDPNSPLGAKGIGEPALLATAPAILNAIYDAVGVRITRLPATPERILEALKEKEQRKLVHAEAAK